MAELPVAEAAKFGEEAMRLEEEVMRLEEEAMRLEEEAPRLLEVATLGATVAGARISSLERKPVGGVGLKGPGCGSEEDKRQGWVGGMV